MKRKEGYMLRRIGKSYMIVPVIGKTIHLKGIITMNETGAYLWELLEKEISKEELLEKMLLEYQIDRETAEADISEFLEKSGNMGILS